jgi:hypothetical protein
MKKKNLFDFIVELPFVKVGKKILDTFNSLFPNTSQNIQLTFIYFFAVVDLMYSVLNNVFSLGGFPEILVPFFPIIKAILTNPILRIWASPEKVFFMSYVVIELMVIRSVLKFSKLVKYNVLLLFAVLMVQGLVISYWDVLFHRQVTSAVANWTYDHGMLIGTNKSLAIVFFFTTFVFFIFGYLYFYIQALRGKFTTLPYLEWLTDSVAFWLRIKTPSMRYGTRKKKKEK